jgi:TatD DNase family protein
MHVGVTGWICDERRGSSLRQAVKHIPLERIMLETDAPYLLPRDLPYKPVKKNRNEPCYLPHIAKSVASYMGIEEKQLLTAVFENSRQFFFSKEK